MELGDSERKAPTRSRISLGALTEVENALRDYEDEVWEAGRARDGIKKGTIRTYIRGPEKFVAWLKYEFAPGRPPKGSAAPVSGIDAPKIKRLTAKRSRISLSALAEAEAAHDEFVRELLHASLGERNTNQLGDHSDYFMRWLRYEFAPGARKNWTGGRNRRSSGPSC